MPASPYSRRRRLGYVCQWTGSERVRHLNILCFHRLTLPDWVGVGKRDAGVSLLSATALMVCITADKKVKEQDIVFI